MMALSQTARRSFLLQAVGQVPTSVKSLAATATTRVGLSAFENCETSFPGVFVAGDASRDLLQIAVALGEGARAAVEINKALLREDGLCS